MDNPESPLNQVISLLETGTDLKNLCQESQRAEEALRKASDIIDEHDLPDPWPQLVSYRLAHILFRNVKSDDDLIEIEGLLTDASLANCLGPLPRLYRLAAMFRLGMKPRKMMSVVDSLLEQIDHYAEYEDAEYEDEEYGDNDDKAQKEDRFDQLTALQNSFFNMLELAVYFTGYPYDGFEGKGLLKENVRKLSLPQLALRRRGALEDRNPYSDLFSKMEKWRLVGNVPGLGSTAYPGEIALTELESRMEKGEVKPPCVAFRISADKKKHHEWNFNLQKNGESFVWKKLRKNTNHLLFLVAIFKFCKCARREDLLFRMFNDAMDKDELRLRKWKERCAGAISKGLRETSTKDLVFDFDKILLDDTRAERAVPQMQPNISVIGAMDAMLSYDDV